MRPLSHLRHAPLRRPSSEAGFALPTVLMAMVAAFALAGGAVIASVSSQSGSVRDQNAKAALGAADAGVSNALLRFNRTPSASGTDICTLIGAGATGADGWCTTPVVEDDFDRGGYTYWVRPTETELEIVSMGTVDGVTRRVQVDATSDSGLTEGNKPFASASVVGLDSILLNSNATINADVATNGNIGLNANSTVNCDYAGVGVGKGISPNNGGTITCPPTEVESSLPPVNPGDVMTNNSNHRICNEDPMQRQQCGTWAWDPATKRLLLNSGGSLTLGAAGGEFNYAFCKVTLNSNSYIYVASGAKVRIYFGAPEECGGETQPLVLNSNSKIRSTAGVGGDLAILIVGSESVQTSVNLNSNAILFDCDQSFVLYAPRTNLTINSNTHICGGVGAKSILVNANSTITASSTASDFELPNTEEHASTGYGPEAFVECSATPPTPPAPPDAGC